MLFGGKLCSKRAYIYVIKIVLKPCETCMIVAHNNSNSPPYNSVHALKMISPG
jgi:hypothetical protein